MNVFHDVVNRNEYRLPVAISCHDIVVDIGAHIGSFAWACYIRGARRIHSFEADFRNVCLAQRNLAPISQAVTVHHAAVWKSNQPESFLFCDDYPTGVGEMNTGGAAVSYEPGLDPNGTNCATSLAPRCVRTIALDSILLEHGFVDIVKMDCEGSEWQILGTSSELQRIGLLCGEYHSTSPLFSRHENYRGTSFLQNVAETSIEDLLRPSFAHVIVKPNEDASLGHFWAWK